MEPEQPQATSGFVDLIAFIAKTLKCIPHSHLPRQWDENLKRKIDALWVWDEVRVTLKMDGHMHVELMDMSDEEEDVSKSYAIIGYCTYHDIEVEYP